MIFPTHGLNFDHITHWYDNGEEYSLVVYFVNGLSAVYRSREREIVLALLGNVSIEESE